MPALRLKLSNDHCASRSLIFCILLCGPILLGSGGLSCSGGGPALKIGEAEISTLELKTAEAGLRVAFPHFGSDHLRWHLLDHGMGPAAILHHRLPEESESARKEAFAAFAQLRTAADFDRLARELLELAPGQEPLVIPSPPTPQALGGRVAAAVASLEAGEWSEPLRTLKGWEIVRLDERAGENRGRAFVTLQRLVFPVGGLADQDDARSRWAQAPLSGREDYLRALPSEFRRNRVQP